MPSASTSDSIYHQHHRHHYSTDLVERIASSDLEIKLKALRDIKNQIIGNRTKKLFYIKNGAVPAVTAALSDLHVTNNQILIESATVLGSFACGFDAGVKAVLDAGAFPHLVRLLSNANEKVADASARSLRMIYGSKLAPKYEFLQHNNMQFVLSLLDSGGENVSGLGASIIAHSCQTVAEQKVLSESGVLKRLIKLLDGTLSQRESSLEALATFLKNNRQVTSDFLALENGKYLTCINELSKDTNPRTTLLASMCLVAIRDASPFHLQDIVIKTKLVHLLLELLNDPSQVGDEASFVFCNLVDDREDVQIVAYKANAIDKFANHLRKDLLHPKRIQGILLALACLCATLETCRSKFLSLQAVPLVANALAHDSTDVRVAACTCLRNVTRSIKNLCAGYFMNQMLVVPLVRLLDDPLVSVQAAALGAIINMVVNFTARKSTFVECGGLKKLIELSESMDSTVKLHALWALRNMMFLADDKLKEEMFFLLNAFLIASLVRDSEPSVQEQALALVRNVTDGSMNSVEFVFAEDGVILDAIVQLLRTSSKPEIGIQGMYALCNVTSGNECQKEAVIHRLLLHGENEDESFMIKFLQNVDSRVRTAAVWVIVNLTCQSPCPEACKRFGRLWHAGIVSQIRRMDNDPCLDVKLRVRTVLSQAVPCKNCPVSSSSVLSDKPSIFSKDATHCFNFV